MRDVRGVYLCKIAYCLKYICAGIIVDFVSFIFIVYVYMVEVC